MRIVDLRLMAPAIAAALLAPCAARASSADRNKEIPSVARAAISRSIGGDQPGYFAQRETGGFRLDHRGITANFTVAGAGIAAGGRTLELSLAAFGREGQINPVEPASPEAAANRVEYRRGALLEWYVNGPAGIEQGFTLPGRPQGSGSVRLELALSGEGSGQVDGGGRDLLWRAGGREWLRYAGLSAFDSAGRELPARIGLDPDGARLTISVDDAGAAYPLTIDPFFQEAKLTASDGAADDGLGDSVAISGDTVVAGAPFAKIGSISFQGAAYIFVKPSSGWATTSTFDAKLTASDGAAGDTLGFSVAISGDTVVAGSVGASSSHGAAYVFVKPGTGWATTSAFDAKLIASDGAINDQLGFYVAISGDTVVAGSPDADIGSNSNQGAAYVFVKPATGWATTSAFDAKLTASDGAAGDTLGSSVAISGDTLVAGAVGVSSVQGAAYVFVKPSSGWATTSTFDAKLATSDGAATDTLGFSVAISGDTVVAGASGVSVSQGAAYVFGRCPTTTMITSIAPAGGGAFTVSFSVAVDSPCSGTADGDVTVSDGVDSCTGTLTNGAGSCTLTVTQPGAVSVTASYAGDGFASSASSSSTLVIPAPVPGLDLRGLAVLALLLAAAGVWLAKTRP